MPYSHKLFGARVREARKARGMTQKQLALRASGFPYQVICHVEHGRQGVSAERLAAIAQALDVSADWLLGISESKTRHDNENGRPT